MRRANAKTRSFRERDRRAREARREKSRGEERRECEGQGDLDAPRVRLTGEAREARLPHDAPRGGEGQVRERAERADSARGHERRIERGRVRARLREARHERDAQPGIERDRGRDRSSPPSEPGGRGEVSTAGSRDPRGGQESGDRHPVVLREDDERDESERGQVIAGARPLRVADDEEERPESQERDEDRAERRDVPDGREVHAGDGDDRERRRTRRRAPHETHEEPVEERELEDHERGVPQVIRERFWGKEQVPRDVEGPERRPEERVPVRREDGPPEASVLPV